MGIIEEWGKVLTKIRFLLVAGKMRLYRWTLDRAGVKSALLKFPAFCCAFQITCNATKPEAEHKKYISARLFVFPLIVPSADCSIIIENTQGRYTNTCLYIDKC